MRPVPPRRLLAFAAALAVLAPLASALAVEPDEVLADPALEARARAISAGLRCLVCQNQSIDDSNAPLARDLRLLVRERLKSGDSDADVRRFVVARYGDFVLLKPPLGPATLLLWLTPLLLLGGVGVMIASRLKAARTTRRPAPAGLSAEEEARLAELVGTTVPEPPPEKPKV